MLLAIDPGKHSIGFAIFRAEKLTSCNLIQGRDPLALIANIKIVFGKEKFDELLIEIPQIYQQRFWRGDPNDLIDVAFVAGSIAGIVISKKLTPIKPRVWKGTRPKAISHKAILAALNAEEIKILNATMGSTPKDLRHNVLDAIGIGKWRIDNAAIDC